LNWNLGRAELFGAGERVGFTAAPLSYALLGQRGCLDFLDVTFRGADQIAELEVNREFPGTVQSGA
jgi:hypothetical protein